MREKIEELIDSLKATLQSFGLANTGNEYTIITQLFLYKYLNDKFTVEIKKEYPDFDCKNWEEKYKNMSNTDRENLLYLVGENTPIFQPDHLLTVLFNKQNQPDYGKILDNTLTSLAKENEEIFATKTTEGTIIPIFSGVAKYITDENQRSDFAKAVVNKLVLYSFEEVFRRGLKYDFFSKIFEYLVKDYNINGGGAYAEYYTPHSIAAIMAKLLVGNTDKNDLNSSVCYDPSAGTGTLLMALAHEIGEERATIYSQDVSQKSTELLKLNLIINSFVSSLPNIVQGNTLTNPYHKNPEETELKKFDFIVSNPPFKMDFSDDRDSLANQTSRFWAGVPSIPAKKKDSMAIYTLFIQHLLNSLNKKGKGAIVVPSGFITAKSGVERKILEKIVDEKWVYGVVSMPSNVFATTGTNVSVLFFDKNHSEDSVILIDASKMGEDYQEGSNKKKRLTEEEIEKITDTFLNKKSVDDFSVCVTYDEIKEKNYSLSAGPYFDIKIEYVEITEEEFNNKMKDFQNELSAMFAESETMSKNILEQLGKVKLK